MKNKIELAKSRIKEIVSKYNVYEIFVGHSGGKDSSVILDLAEKVIKDDFIIVHNVKKLYLDKEESGKTDVDLRTFVHLYNNVPKDGRVLQLVDSVNMPNFLRKNSLKLQIDGSRVEEFSREDKSSTFIKDGKDVSRLNMDYFEKNGLFNLDFLYPIFDWSYEDVFNYLAMNNIPLSSEYDDDEEYLKWRNQ